MVGVSIKGKTNWSCQTYAWLATLAITKTAAEKIKGGWNGKVKGVITALLYGNEG